MGPWSAGPSGARCASQSSVTAPSDSVSDRSSAGRGQQGRGWRGRGRRCHGGRGPGGRGLGARCVPRSYIVGRTDQKYNEIMGYNTKTLPVDWPYPDRLALGTTLESVFGSLVILLSLRWYLKYNILGVSCRGFFLSS